MHADPLWATLALWPAAHACPLWALQGRRLHCGEGPALAAAPAGHQETPHISRSEWSVSLECRALCWGPSEGAPLRTRILGRLPPVLMIPKAISHSKLFPRITGNEIYC